LKQIKKANYYKSRGVRTLFTQQNVPIFFSLSLDQVDVCAFALFRSLLSNKDDKNRDVLLNKSMNFTFADTRFSKIKTSLSLRCVCKCFKIEKLPVWRMQFDLIAKIKPEIVHCFVIRLANKKNIRFLVSCMCVLGSLKKKTAEDGTKWIWLCHRYKKETMKFADKFVRWCSVLIKLRYQFFIHRFLVCLLFRCCRKCSSLFCDLVRSFSR